MWAVPRMWDGQTVAILASGPSMSQSVADKVSHLPCIAINTTYRLAPWAEVIYAHDAAWWNHHADAKELPGLKVGGERAAGVLTLKNTGLMGFDPDPSCMRVGGNSGYQALHLAIQAGASRILLLGYDMTGGHWHGKHPAQLGNAGEGAYQRWMPRFESLIPAIEDRYVDVINCTPGSKLTTFRMMSLEQAIASTEPVEVAS